MLPVETNIRDAYNIGQDAEQKFIANLALFLSTYLKERGSLIEVDPEKGNKDVSDAHTGVKRKKLRRNIFFLIILKFWLSGYELFIGNFRSG